MKGNRENDDLSSRNLLKDIFKILAFWSMAAVLRNAFKKGTKKQTENGMRFKWVAIAFSAAGLLVLGIALYAIVGSNRPPAKESQVASSRPMQRPEEYPGAVRGYRRQERGTAEESGDEKQPLALEERRERGRTERTLKDGGQKAEYAGRTAEGRKPDDKGRMAEVGGKTAANAGRAGPPVGGGRPYEAYEKGEGGARSKDNYGGGIEKEELAALKRQVDQLNMEVARLKGETPPAAARGGRPTAVPEEGLEGASDRLEKDLQREINRLQGEVEALSRMLSHLQQTAIRDRQEERGGAEGAEQEFGRVEREMTALKKEVSQLEVKKTPAGMTVVLRDFLFEFGESDLMPGAERSLRLLADVLKRHPSHRILIEGFTDSTGDPAYNIELSRRRAAAVEKALVAEGIDPNRITARGHGEEYPVATNQTRAGRQLNRRVEITLLNGGPSE